MAIERRGIPTNICLDPDAKVLLRELAPGAKAYGRFVSELLRREDERRRDREQLRQELHHAVEVVLAK
jgi:hypothetical protein